MKNKKVELKGAEEIFQELRQQAKEGRCQWCQWCYPLCQAELLKLEHELENLEGDRSITNSRICLLESDGHPSEPLIFTVSELRGKRYPRRCNLGSFLDDANESIPECLAYSQNPDQVNMMMASGGNYRNEAVQDAVARHTMFMIRLGDAVTLETDIREKKLEKLLDILNGVTKDPLLEKEVAA